MQKFSVTVPSQIKPYFEQILMPKPDSHKGQNGKLMIIGGSELFHAASRWSLDVASKFVDMVFYASVPSNNELIQAAKAEFWNGIVINRNQIENYANEADVILIGPGMDRSSATSQITNRLFQLYPTKKWVIDAGALQMFNLDSCPTGAILTPHLQELETLGAQLSLPPNLPAHDLARQIINRLPQATLLLKGQIDLVLTPNKSLEISGGNAGMTKGGTGDVLSGLVAALYCTHSAETACVVGSFVNKKAGEWLWQTVGPNFNASDLVAAIPQVMWQFIKS